MKINSKNNTIKEITIFFIVFLLTIFITGCIEQNNNYGKDITNSTNDKVLCNTQILEDSKMKISIESNGKKTFFELNDSQAAKEFYEQLPLTSEVKDYSNNEKIFYPPKKLNTTNTPLANAKFGTLAYYAPWGDVVIFYDSFGSARGLYELGNVISGGENIENMSGTIKIEKV
ncbi:cyclophilin-like fold protein [Methanococcus voltae]|uniref:Cyclophilin-like domain-containing protein n=1 Tax=Methanococcus voltae (strain ATCC BAA-1334 / A3) TaxID=456320 RepID=D7DSW8_METV3|nr:cyclophilin-like fold protein [Methanococcus voltae]MCS3901882.1 hypothetical protein [Methanococcus voltae]